MTGVTSGLWRVTVGCSLQPALWVDLTARSVTSFNLTFLLLTATARIDSSLTTWTGSSTDILLLPAHECCPDHTIFAITLVGTFVARSWLSRPLALRTTLVRLALLFCQQIYAARTTRPGYNIPMLQSHPGSYYFQLINAVPTIHFCCNTGWVASSSILSKPLRCFCNYIKNYWLKLLEAKSNI